MNSKQFWIKIGVPVVVAIISATGAYFAGGEAVKNDISIQVNNVVNPNGGSANYELDVNDLVNAYYSQSDRIKESADAIEDLREENKSIEDELRKTRKDLNAAEEKLEEKDNKIAELERENGRLNEENNKIKDILLQDNTYADSLDDLVIVKKTTKRLGDLFLIDSDEYSTSQMLEDSHGNIHTYAYKFETQDTAFARYKLNGQYDVFSAVLVTGQDTTRDAVFCVEILVDNVSVAQYKDITTAKESYTVGPISVRNADELKILVARMEGYYGETLYVTDESLSVVE